MAEKEKEGGKELEWQEAIEEEFNLPYSTFICSEFARTHKEHSSLSGCLDDERLWAKESEDVEIK
jgi:hypothetical protein